MSYVVLLGKSFFIHPISSGLVFTLNLIHNINPDFMLMIDKKESATMKADDLLTFPGLIRRVSGQYPYI